MRRRVLLVLDGVEPLQCGPGTQPGQLKDQGLRTLLRHFAAAPPAAAHGLLMLTSRLADNISANLVGLALGTAFRYLTYKRFVFATGPSHDVRANSTTPLPGPDDRELLVG